MNIINLVISYIQKHMLIPSGTSVLVGLSGGPDSVFLLHVLVLLRNQGLITDFMAAHLDHQWREDSAKDAQFCKDLCKKWKVPLIINKLSDLGISQKSTGSKEELGRRARRQFFEQVKRDYELDRIALAHHAQDQQETFFIRLIRGTSLTGLTGMRPQSGDYIRPLLELNKNDIVAYLDKHAIPYIIDPSNLSEEYLRNRIRLKVIPALQACDTRFDQNFAQTLARLQETEDYLEEHTTQEFAKIATPDYKTITVNNLLSYPSLMRYRLLMHWMQANNVRIPLSQSFLDEILRFLSSPHGGAHDLHHEWRIEKKSGMATISKN
ncbi:MAG: tRNA lysidine(34) synthetase TilS [Candidatus Dependentiae bacterium]